MNRCLREWLACAAMMLAAAGCGGPPPPDLETVASGYIRLARELARHDPSLIDHWLREPPPLEAPRRPVGELQRELDALIADVAGASGAGVPEPRAEHLARQLQALGLAARRLLGESAPFDEEARTGLGLAAIHVDATDVAEARAALDRELPGAGPLARRVASFRQRLAVPEDRREPVMRAALGLCRSVTRNAMPLPADESIELTFVPGLPWDAHARYLGSHRTRIDINASQTLDLARALHLACHEGYPGHHVQYLFLDDEVIGRRGWNEFAMVPGFGPDLLVSEGAAEAGVALALPFERRVAAYRDHLAPAAGLSTADVERLARVEAWLSTIEPVIGAIAREYLDNRITMARAVERLEDEALIADAEAFVHFIERRRTRLLAYPEGRRLVLQRVGDEGIASLNELLVRGVGR